MEEKPQQGPQPGHAPRWRREEKKGGAARWLAWIFGILLVLSFSLNVMLAMMLAADVGGILKAMVEMPAEEEKYQEVFAAGDRKSKNKVLLVPVEGVLLEEPSGWLGPSESIVTEVRRKLEQAADDQAIKAVILEIDSPGGSITTSELIRHEILLFREKRKDVHVIGLMKDVAASGGYYISTPCDYIIAHETTITGSIGVISQFINLQGLCEKVGVEFVTIKSKDRKDIGSPFRPMSDEERQLFKAIIDEMYEKFVDVVVEGRKGKLSREEVLALADGMVYTGKQALDKKLVDELGFFDTAVDKVMEFGKLADVKVIRYRKKTPALPLGWLLGKAQSSLPTEIIPSYRDVLRETSPKFMFLWWPVTTGNE